MTWVALLFSIYILKVLENNWLKKIDHIGYSANDI